MTFGIILKAVNNIHFGDYLDLFFEFLPQIIFMCVTFIYMDFMIVVKWLTPWGTAGNNISDAPSIITVLINLLLKGGDTNGNNIWGTGN